MKGNPVAALVHENMGFLYFADGKDKDASREFSTAFELDQKLYLSLYWKTMLSPKARSEKPADQDALHDELLKVLDLNNEYAPAFMELAKLYVRQGNLAKALGVSRRAEQLEPSRSGYHLLSGQILLRMGRGTEAA